MVARLLFGEAGQTWSFRGSKSRNKVSVGEPAEGSLTNPYVCEECKSFLRAIQVPVGLQGPAVECIYVCVYE